MGMGLFVGGRGWKVWIEVEVDGKIVCFLMCGGGGEGEELVCWECWDMVRVGKGWSEGLIGVGGGMGGCEVF